MGFLGGAGGKEPACQCRRCGDVGSAPGSGRSPGGGHGNPLQYSCLENPMDRGAWWATVYKVAESQTIPKQLSTHVCCESHRWRKLWLLMANMGWRSDFTLGARYQLKRDHDQQYPNGTTIETDTSFRKASPQPSL